jgi:hypothetical protein
LLRSSFFIVLIGFSLLFHSLEKVVIRNDFGVIMANFGVIIAPFVVILSDSVVITRQNVVITHKAIEESTKNCPGNQHNTDFLDNCIMILIQK